MSCILAFYIAGRAARSLLGRAPVRAALAGWLYRHREDIASAKQAADIWAKDAAAGKDFEATWKLARALLLARHAGAGCGRRTALDKGVHAGEQAISSDASKPGRPLLARREHGRAGRVFGLVQGIKYRGRIRDELERVLQIDAAGSRDRPTARSAGGTTGARPLRRQREQGRRRTSASRSPTTRRARSRCISWRRCCSSAGARTRRERRCSRSSMHRSIRIGRRKTTATRRRPGKGSRTLK